ncbi:MAG: hypothetical protein J5I90_08220 [Caldilineales bacterium]|nr:hypothetical protein [Caldilineales bacterium]
MAARRRVLTLAILLAILALGSRGAIAQEADGVWQALGGPLGAVTLIAADPASPDFVMLAVTHAVSRNNDRTQSASGGMEQSWATYFSTDGGETWQPASNDMAHAEPTALAIYRTNGNSTIWMGTAEDGLWRSDNAGRTWRPALVNGLDDQRVVALTQDSRGDLHMLTIANTRYPDSYFYSSDDGGFNWQQRVLQRYTGSPDSYPTDLSADPFQAGRFYVPTLGGLLYTDNGGLTWRRSPVPLPEGALADGDAVLTVDPTQRGRLFLAVRNPTTSGGDAFRLYRSLDGAVSWEDLSATFSGSFQDARGRLPRLLRLRQDTINRHQFYLATSNGLWVSTDSGLNWNSAGTALEGTAVADVYSHGQRRGQWIGIGAGGAWKTANAGSLWRALADGLPAASRLNDVVNFENDPDTLLTLSGGVSPLAGSVQTVWRSQDGGKSWMPAMDGLAGVYLNQLRMNPAEPDAVYGLAADGLARSTDKGRNWRFIPTPSGPTDLAFGERPGQLFVGTFQGVWRSDNGGSSWEPAGFDRPIKSIVTGAAGDLNVVATSDTGNLRLWNSTDAGNTWGDVGPLPGGDANRLLAHPFVQHYLILLMNWGGIQISLDGGKSWFRSDSGIPAGVHWRGAVAEEPEGPNILSLYIDPRDPAMWWASRDGGGVYRSEDNGRTWEAATADLGDTLILAFAHNDELLVAGSSNAGLLTRTASAIPPNPPELVDARIEILWPHDYAPVTQADLANLGLRLYGSRSQEPPPCAWQPTVEVWMAQDAEPLRRLDMATQRTVDGQPFPFWELNDVDVSAANDPDHKLVFLARVAPGLAESASSPWIHAADARTFLPEPPQPTGVTSSPPAAVDAVIRVVWPHDVLGQAVSSEGASLANISAILFAQDTNITLAPEHLPERVWLVGSLDNQVGRRIMAGEQRTVQGDGFIYTAFEFNNVDVSLARSPDHHWTFWLDVPGVNASSNVWVHGIDSRTNAPQMLEPITGCLP